MCPKWWARSSPVLGKALTEVHRGMFKRPAGWRAADMRYVA